MHKLFYPIVIVAIGDVVFKVSAVICTIWIPLKIQQVVQIWGGWGASMRTTIDNDGGGCCNDHTSKLQTANVEHDNEEQELVTGVSLTIPPLQKCQCLGKSKD